MTASPPRSIKRMLITLSLAAGGLALLIVLAATLLFETTTFRPRTLEQLRREAVILAEALQAPLTFLDRESASSFLKTRRAVPEIAIAAVYDVDRLLFAEYHRTDIATSTIPQIVQPAGTRFSARQLEFWQPLTADGHPSGHLYLARDLPPLYARLPQYRITIAAVGLALLVVAGVFIFGVRKNLLRPMSALMRTTAQVAHDSDFNIRATVYRDDELGTLARAFNQMLEAIGERDRALRAASERIESVFAAATEVAIISTNPEGIITVFNTGATRMLGYTAEELVGKTTTKLWHLPAEVARRAEEMTRELGRPIEGFETFVARARSGQPENREWTYVRKNGEHFPVQLMVTAVRDNQGNVTGFLGIATDISQRKQSEVALRESEIKFRTLFDTANDAIFLFSATKGFISCNAKTHEIFGCTDQEFIGQSPIKFFPINQPDGRLSVEKAPEKIDLAFAGIPQFFEWQHSRLNGTPFDAEVSLNRIELKGEVLLQAIVRDITERKRAEAQLRLRENHFRSLIENATDLITVLDQNAIIRYQSPSSVRLLGYQPELLLGRHVFEFVHPEDVATAQAVLQDLLTQPTAHTTTKVRLRHHNGSWREIETMGRLYLDEAEGKQIILNSRDITESIKLEEQFRQAQKLEAIGQLSGGVAHDFNNILTAIIGHSSLLEMHDKLPAECRDSLNEIKIASARAASLTRQLLTFSRRQTMQQVTLDLNVVVVEMTKMLQRILGEHIRMQLLLTPQPAMIHADASMMEQILLNLAVNARDAMPKGGRLIIETEIKNVVESMRSQLPQARPGDFICLSVSDTGCGIPAEIQSRIFEPFFTTKDVGQGTGLGLATVYGIVQQHQGWIQCYSEVGQGTTFRVYLPRQCRTTHPALSEKTSSTPIIHGQQTILLVEDESVVSALVHQILSKAGYHILDAASGVTALEIWQQHHDRIDLLLTDLVMPDGISGHELATRLLAEKPHLPIIYTSGYSLEIAGKDFPLKTGVNFLAKPFNPEQLLEVVHAALHQRKISHA